MEQLRDLVVTEEGRGVAGRRAADHQQTGAERGARDPGEVLDRLERVALGARQLADLLRGDRSPVDLAAVVAARLDDGLVRVEDQRLGVVGELEALVVAEALDRAAGSSVRVATALAPAGAAASLVGSTLIILDITGYFQ